LYSPGDSRRGLTPVDPVTPTNTQSIYKNILLIIARPEGSHSARDLIISCAASGLPASLSKDVHFVGVLCVARLMIRDTTGSSWFCGWYPSSGTDQLCLERGCPCWLEEPLHLRSPDCRIPPSGVLVQSSSAVHCIHYYIALFPPEISPGYLDASLLDGPVSEPLSTTSTSPWKSSKVTRHC
ncbi:hypothetical protein N7526_007323, partial [Penicillium atrosanguineum]